MLNSERHNEVWMHNIVIISINLHMNVRAAERCVRKVKVVSWQRRRLQMTYNNKLDFSHTPTPSMLQCPINFKLFMYSC